MGVELLTHGRVTWVNIEQPTAADMNFLRERYPFHPLDLEELPERLERSKIDEYED